MRPVARADTASKLNKTDKTDKSQKKLPGCQIVGKLELADRPDITKVFA